MVSTFGTCPSGTWFGQTAALVEIHSDWLNCFLLKLLKWTVQFFFEMSFIVVEAIR